MQTRQTNKKKERWKRKILDEMKLDFRPIYETGNVLKEGGLNRICLCRPEVMSKQAMEHCSVPLSKSMMEMENRW